jgi:HK97 family phage portal protein
MPDYTFSDRLKHAWNAFTSRDPTPPIQPAVYGGFSYRPDKLYYRRGGERSVVASIITRIAIDAAAIDMKHVKQDEEGRYLQDMKSGLNNVLTLEANIDQTSRDFLQDIVQSLLEEGSVCVVPVETSIDPRYSDSYQINTMRVGKIVQWYPQHVKVDLYNDQTGKHQEVTLPKKMVAIVMNPLYAVMNEPNSTLQRLIRKLALLDVVDEQSSSGKLDLIIQLPYVVKSQTRKEQAEERRKQIETQLTGSKYGIAYTDGTERITQLNRPVENNLLKQVEYLTNMLYGQLGITEEVLKGTADEKTMLNYYNRTIEPILSAISLEFKRKFLTKTARSQGQSIEFYRDPFRLVPVNDMAEIADKFTRNEIMTSNEVRQAIGMKPSDDPKADELVNSNLYSDPSAGVPMEEEPPMDEAAEEPMPEEENPGDIPISEIMN